MLLKFITLFCILSVSLANNSEWESFKLKYGRKYSNPTEESYRKKIFLDNKMTIEKHNQQFYEGKTTFTMGINQFADMTNQEYNKNMKQYPRITKKINPSRAQPLHEQVNPDSVDWRDTGCVTGVKDQGQCGCDWAFACTEVTEFVMCQATGKLLSCSEQNLMDCTLAYGNMCCNGGTVDAGLQYIVEHGLDTEASNPFTARCRVENCQNQALEQCTINGYGDVVPHGSESVLETAVALFGPVIATVDASHASFQLYTAGVYNEPACLPTQLDHYVLVVGYGVNGGTPYWLIKNSWGVSWGMNGYMEMIKDKGNQCGIASQATYAY